MEYKYPKFTPFNDHSNCAGHANFMLDCTYEKEEDRKLIQMVLDNYIEE